jgi:hypothetical protein
MGQQHESTAFEPLMRRVLLPRRRGTPYWPTKLAGDKGYSYPHIRRWSHLDRRTFAYAFFPAGIFFGKHGHPGLQAICQGRVN